MIRVIITLTFVTHLHIFLSTSSLHSHHCAASRFKGISAVRLSDISADASAWRQLRRLQLIHTPVRAFVAIFVLLFFFTASSCYCRRYYCFAVSVLQCERIRYSVFYGFPF